MTRTATVVSITAAVVALAAAATFAVLYFTSTPTQPTQPAQTRLMTVNGNITLTTTHIYHWSGQPGEPCHGIGPYQDMAAGARVTVYNGAGTAVATGELREGQWGVGCMFPFSVTDVPVSTMLQVEVGSRGKVAFGVDDVKNGKVKLTVGP